MFFHIVNNHFVINNEAITLIYSILQKYEMLLKNSVSTETIDLLIFNWTKSNNVNPLVEKQNLTNLKMSDKSCRTLSRFKEIYHETYITDVCLMLVQKLIDGFFIHRQLIKQTLQNLLPLMKLLADIDLVTTHSWNRLTFLRKLRNTTTFFDSNLFDVIYREAYLIFLVQQRDSKLLASTNYSRSEVTTSTNNYIMLSSNDLRPNINVLMYGSPKCILDDYITDINSIQSIRSVDKQLCAHYNSKTMASVAVFNLKNIIQHFFMLNVDEFLTAMLSCDAIIGGSVVAQSFYGGPSELLKDFDLDVYYKEGRDLTVLHQLIFSAGYQLYNKELSEGLREKYFYSNHVPDRSSPSIVSVTTFKNKQRRVIQIIAVRPFCELSTFNFGRYVVSTYELSFLKNFFDGDSLYTFDFPGVITKSGSIDSKLLERITLDDDVLDCYDSLYTWYREYTATIVRCIKYQKQGFHIDNVPSFSLLEMLAL